MLAIFVKVPTM